jgi:hypothetical protein
MEHIAKVIARIAKKSPPDVAAALRGEPNPAKGAAPTTDRRAAK